VGRMFATILLPDPLEYGAWEAIAYEVDVRVEQLAPTQMSNQKAPPSQAAAPCFWVWKAAP
jgi:hypothetical protein